MVKVIVRAPGKIILHGEHAVVYGKKAIACAIDGNITVELKDSSENGLIISMDDLNCDIHIKQDHLENLYQQLISGQPDFENFDFQNNVRSYIEQQEYSTDSLVQATLAVCVFGYLKVFTFERKSNPSLIISATGTNLPIGAGLGSSAALNVSLSAAFLVYLGVVSSDEVNAKSDKALSMVNKLAFSMERVVHGTPSGIDNTVATYGGALVYKNGEVRTLPSFGSLNILILDTGISRNTKELVLRVREKYNQDNKKMIGLLDEFDAISEHAEKILSNADNMITNEQIESLKKLITQNQQLLYQIGVSHPSIDQITKLSIKLGFACKLTGAGGGGCAIILLDPSDPGKRTELESELLKMGYKGWEAKLGGPGVKVLSYDDVQL